MNQNYTLCQLNLIAKKIIDNAKCKVLLFYGELGVGKTSLIKQICQNLGVEDLVGSPTFSIINQYKTFDNQYVYHFDFYRIKNQEEAYDLGIEEYFYSGNWCFVEWPENIKNSLPLKAVSFIISQLKSGQRNIKLKTG
ncbi:MAG: tRNA (adenosine(37)-N6)-threonylcarbamoyltransferase complex ATPase subunit type 1 TsaE [Tenacibaculum sp.]